MPPTHGTMDSPVKRTTSTASSGRSGLTWVAWNLSASKRVSKSNARSGRNWCAAYFDAHGGLENFDRYFDHIYDVFRSKESWRVFEDVTESGLLDQLKNKGVVLGVVSNWDSRLPEILKNTGLASYFNFILASTVVGSAKPDATIFKEALQRAGVSPDEACHIGDEPATDIEGARNMGIHSILIDRKGHHNGETLTKVKSFHELL